MANEKNLEKGIPTRFTSGESAVTNGSKGGRASKRNHDLRKLGQMMLKAAMDVDPSTLAAVRQFGLSLDSDKPEAQMLLLANAMQMALNKKAKPADRIMATDKVLEMAGMDVRTNIAAEDRKLKREQMKFEREKWEAEQKQQEESTSANIPQVIDDIGGADE